MAEEQSPSAADCTSCGEVAAHDVVAVHRMYVTPPPFGSEPDAEPTVRREDDVEHWCSACRTHYPHQLIDGAPDT